MVNVILAEQTVLKGALFETAKKKLFAEAEGRVHQWAKKKMHEELLELRRVETETDP
jgi:hypothetical protein